MYDDVAVEGSDGGGSDLTFSWMVLVVNFNGIGNRGESSSSVVCEMPNWIRPWQQQRWRWNLEGANLPRISIDQCFRIVPCCDGLAFGCDLLSFVRFRCAAFHGSFDVDVDQGHQPIL